MKMNSLMLTKALVLLVLFAAVTGCQTLNSLGDYVSDNPVFASMATRHAVSRYIAAGETPEAETERATAVHERITRVLSYLEGDPNVDVDGLLLVVNNVIDWDKLNPADRMLATDIVTLIEIELRKYESQSPTLTASTQLALRGLFDTAISAASYYLME